MIKRIAQALLLLGLCAALTPAAWAQPVLHDHARIEGDVIRFGDLFQNAGDKAEVAIAKAPAPGARIILDADRLTRIARAHKFPWRARSSFERVVVERAGTAIPKDAIMKALEDALLEQGAPKNMQIAFADRDFQIYVPADRPATIAMKRLEYDKRTQYFSATLVSPASGLVAKEFRVSGRTHATVAIPVLHNRADHGDILRKQDIQWIQMRADRIGANTITASSDLIGKTPHRMILAGKAIDKNGVRRPILVEKGDIVTMTYRTSSMTLTMKGRALDQGSQKDMIRVLNVQSKMVIDAIVTGQNKVSAFAQESLAMKGDGSHVR